MPHPSDTVANLGMHGRACCVRVCMRVRLWVLTRLRCHYERNDVRMVVSLCVYACVRVRACVRACVRRCVRACVCACVRACVRDV